MSTEERSKGKINNGQNMHLFVFPPRHRRSPPHTPHLRSSYDSMQAASSQIPKNSYIKNSQILKLPPVGQWVCDKSRDKIFSQPPRPLLILSTGLAALKRSENNKMRQADTPAFCQGAHFVTSF